MSAAAEARRPLACAAAALAALLVMPPLLTGCASLRAPPTVLPPDVQEQLLLALPGFSLKGRALVQQEIASLDWQQREDDARVRLSGPFGAGAITVDFSPARLTISLRGEAYDNAAAETVLLREIGFVPPFDALRYWVLGLAAPGEPPSARTGSEEGRLGSLTQRGWHIRYEQWQAVAARGGGVQLPRRVTITRDDLRLRVVVDRWKL
ncbi:MAG: outer membrane lipoprotein LolB [Pseudomonadota bacterium]|jgi:outer membrane lipoprotein LolB